MSFPDTPTQAPPTAPPPARQRPRRGTLLAVAIGAIALMTLTGLTVWLVARPDDAPPAAAAATFDVDGIVRLQRGEFVWQSQTDTRCWGLGGYSDITGGGKVTVTDASGKRLAVADLQTGGAEGITVDGRASSCVLKFKVVGVPRGAGPYGVEITHRGVVTYPETELTSTVLTLGFS